MSKISLTNLVNLQNETTAVNAINANNATLTTALDNTLSRDGTTPNTMSASLDMNSNRILNLPAAVFSTDPVRLAEVGNAAAQATAAAASASAASASASAASGSASSASTSASNASTSATNAATSATNASTSATNAAASALTSFNNASVVAGNFYNFSTTTTMADPSSSNLRFNNATVSSVTALAFSVNTGDAGNPSIRSFLTTWGASSSTANRGTILIRKVGTPATFAIFSVTSVVTDNVTWAQMTVSYVTGNGSFSNADSLSIQFYRTGDAGSGTISGAVNHGVGLATGAASMSSTAVMTDGQLLVGQSAADPLPKTITGDVTFTAAGASAIKSNVSLPGNPVAAGSFSSGGSISALGSDANFALGGNRAVMDQAAGVIRIGAINGGGSAVSLTLYNNNVAAMVINSAGTAWTFGSGVVSPGFTFAGSSGTSTVNVGSAGVSGGNIFIAGSSSGGTAIIAPAAASGTVTLPAGGTFTGSSSTAVFYDNIPQNSQSVAYQLVAADAQKHILHPSADTTARVFTIPANSTVAFPIGTAVTFVNQNAGGVITIAITTDTMRLAGAGTTGSRTLAANGIATALKVTSTEWIISGTGLT